VHDNELNPGEPFPGLSGYPETFRNHSWAFPVVRKLSGTIPHISKQYFAIILLNTTQTIQKVINYTL
jgi:hypothetical protein